MSRLLIVEDDPTLRTGLEDAFAGEGHDVTAVGDGDVAHDLLFERHFDLVILDVMLPGRGGLELLRAFRDAGQQTPVLLLTARCQENDKVLGLELGADDYVTKPFGLRELIARVRALLRRLGHDGASAPADRFVCGHAEVDLGAYELRCTRSGTVHRLSPKEARMLALLHEAGGKAVSRDRFLNEVWGSDAYVGTRTVDTHVLNLRQKLEADPRAPVHLQTVHGVGYRLVLGVES